MDAIRPAHVLAERKQPDVVDDRLAAAAVGLGIAGAAHDVGGRSPGRSPSSSAFSFSRSGGSITSSASSQKA